MIIKINLIINDDITNNIIDNKINNEINNENDININININIKNEIKNVIKYSIDDFYAVKNMIREDLGNITFFSLEIVSICLSWLGRKVYYNFLAHSTASFLGCFLPLSLFSIQKYYPISVDATRNVGGK